MAELDPFPLFPLHTVLFPGGALPLHIFEPRYRLMIGRCLEADAPFGAVLIRAGREVGDPAEPYRVGTVARIVEHRRLDDGRMYLLCLGGARFRIDELRHDEPYLAARVSPLEEAPPEPDAGRLAHQVRTALGRFLATARAEADLRLPDDPTALSFALADALPLPLGEQQALLELTSTAERLGRLTAILEREQRLRDRVGATKPAGPHRVPPPSPN